MKKNNFSAKKTKGTKRKKVTSLGIEYRGYQIEPVSCLVSKNKWVPRCRLVPLNKGKRGADFPLLTWEKKLDSKIQADNYALESAQIYIANQLSE